MTYEYRPTFDNSYALNDFKAAKNNYRTALARLREQQAFPTRSGDIEQLQADVKHFKAILKDISRYVTVAGGHRI